MIGARAIGPAIHIAILCTLYSAAGEDDSAIAHIRNGIRHSRNDQPDEAIAAFSLALQAKPAQPTVLMLRGDEHVRLRKYNRAIVDYSAAIRLDAGNVDMLIRRARCYVALKLDHAALGDCSAALSLRPDDPEALAIRSRLRYISSDFEGALTDAKKVVLFGDDWIAANMAVGHCQIADRNDREAIEAYDRILVLDPGNAQALYWSSQAFQYLDREDEAVARIQELIRANPSQRGGYARPWPYGKELSADDLAHGRAQLVQLFKDRPAMAHEVKLDDEISLWAARKFAGEDTPGRLVWDATQPTDAFADHLSPQNGRSGRVRMRRHESLLFGHGPSRRFSLEEQWKFLAFELHNVQSHARFHELDELAVAGELTREGYVKEMARLEFHALQRTRAWYLDYFRPWAKAQNINSDPNVWRIDLPLTFDEFLAHYTDKNLYPWQPYGEYYDRLRRWGPSNHASPPEP
ncbi:MAG: hypothetical protein L0211_10530 [Planctomycetaceae bacterium]|nr:hypothetical protein [Planctomycetaceae bacterium]